MAKIIVDEEMRFKIIINGNEAQKELHDLTKSTDELISTNNKLRTQRNRLKRQGKENTEQYKKLSNEITKNTGVINNNYRRMKTLENQIGITGLTMQQLTKKAKDLNLVLRRIDPKTAQYKKYRAELDQVNGRLSKLKSRANSAKLSLSSLSRGFNKYAVLGASAIASMAGVVYKLQQIIDYNGKLSDAQSDVIKTTGLTKKEVNELSKSFGLLKTRTTRIELLKLAEEAGRLGIEGVKNVKDFVEVANQLKVALGDDLNDTQIREVGKMAKIYQVGIRTGRNFKDTLLSLGSAINEVSASGANQAGFLVDYLKRQAGVAAQTKISAQDNIGYAATFDELGQSVEVSATAMNKVWVDMFKDSASYAKVAGIGVTEFTNLLQTDANEAMIAFLKGLNGNNEGLAVMAKKFEGLEVGGARGVAALAALASNTALLEKRQITANEALEDASSLTKEYEEKNNNLAASIEKIKNKFTNLFSSQSINKGLNRLIGFFGKLIGAIDDVDEAFLKETKSAYANAQANRKLADESEKLLEEYEDLSKGVNLTAKEKEKLDIITIQLKNRLGESIIEINKETGAFTLNAEAVREQIKIKRIAADEEASMLFSRLQGTNDRLADLKREKESAKKEFDAQLKTYKKVNDVALLDINSRTIIAEKDKEIFRSRLEGYKETEEAREKYVAVSLRIEKQTERQIDLEKKLDELNFTKKDVEKYFKTSVTPKNKEGDTQNIGGLIFTFKNGEWVLKVPPVTPGTKREVEKLVEQIATITKELDVGDNGIDLSILTPKQKEEIKQQTDDFKTEVEKVITTKNLLTGKQEEVDLGEAGQMDVLGFSADQWLSVFSNLDTLQGKFKAAQIVVGGLLNLWNTYQQFVEANEAKSMALFEARTAKKKDRLKDQLDNGVISQRTYTKEVDKIEKQHDKTQRELEYQQAERAHKRMLINAIGQAAMAILSGLMSTPFMPVGIAMGALAAILGGIQVGIVAKNKPVKGYESGLYPVQREQDGQVFNAQYGGQVSSGLVTSPTVFMAGENNKPEMIIDNQAYKSMTPGFRDSLHREIARVKGFEGGYYSQQQQIDNSSNDALMLLVSRNIEVLNQIKNEGIIAIVSSKDYNNMKEIKEGLDNYNELRNKNKI